MTSSKDNVILPVEIGGTESIWEDQTVAGGQDALRMCLRHLLRPIVSFCLRRSLKLQDVVDELKGVFVSVAGENLERDGTSSSVSRISVMTGVHRKDVSHLLEGTPAPREETDVMRRIIGQWLSDRRFCSKKGSPRQLTLAGRQGEFAELVSCVSKELNPYTVLVELERQQLVTREEDGITLLREAFVPKGDFSESCKLVSEDLHDLLQAAEENTLGEKELPNLHLTTRYDNICLESVPKIQAWMLKQGEQLHKRARDYLARFDKDLNPKLSSKKGGAKVSIGSFGFTATPIPENQTDKSTEKS